MSNALGEQGLPTALQFVARAYQENCILEVAAAYQAATDFHRRAPA